MSVEDLFKHVRREASDDDDDDGKPGRTAGQKLHKNKVHILGVQERPAKRKKKQHGCYTIHNRKITVSMRVISSENNYLAHLQVILGGKNKHRK